MNLAEAIEAECRKLISRHCKRIATEHATRERFQRATGRVAAKGKSDGNPPVPWTAHEEFNPYRIRPRAKPMAKAIETKILAGTYSPRPALILQIKKPTGGARPISIFTVADAAVATVYYRRILARNQSRLSPFSYAYRRDLTVHDAIERLSRTMRGAGRLYLVEFDFSKYFDTISHDHVMGVLSRHFQVTRSEQNLIASLLRCPRAFGVERYKKGEFAPTKCGVPQGNSLSLFLANVACHELDLALFHAGVQFVRYADDIVMLCDNDRLAGKGLSLIAEHCERAGLSVNFRKSDGITEFSPAGLRPDKSHIKASFDFVGHRFSFATTPKRDAPAPLLVRRTSIRQRTVNGIRRKLSNIIYAHLLRYPMKGMLKPSRVSRGVDWDVVTCINDLRGYIYGGIHEATISAALGSRDERLHLPRGIMAFFPLVDDIVQLKKLDGWLLNALARAIDRRRRLIRKKKLTTLEKTYPRLGAKKLRRATWYRDALRASKKREKSKKGKKPKDIKNEVQVPSFVRAWKYARKGLLAFNLQQFPFRGSGDGEPDLYD